MSSEAGISGTGAGADPTGAFKELIVMNEASSSATRSQKGTFSEVKYLLRQKDVELTKITIDRSKPDDHKIIFTYQKGVEVKTIAVHCKNLDGITREQLGSCVITNLTVNNSVFNAKTLLDFKKFQREILGERRCTTADLSTFSGKLKNALLKTVSLPHLKGNLESASYSLRTAVSGETRAYQAAVQQGKATLNAQLTMLAEGQLSEEAKYGYGKQNTTVTRGAFLAKAFNQQILGEPRLTEEFLTRFMSGTLKPEDVGQIKQMELLLSKAGEVPEKVKSKNSEAKAFLLRQPGESIKTADGEQMESIARDPDRKAIDEAKFDWVEKALNEMVQNNQNQGIRGEPKLTKEFLKRFMNGSLIAGDIDQMKQMQFLSSSSDQQGESAQIKMQNIAAQAFLLDESIKSGDEQQIASIMNGLNSLTPGKALTSNDIAKLKAFSQNKSQANLQACADVVRKLEDMFERANLQPTGLFKEVIDEVKLGPVEKALNGMVNQNKKIRPKSTLTKEFLKRFMNGALTAQDISQMKQMQFLSTADTRVPADLVRSQNLAAKAFLLGEKIKTIKKDTDVRQQAFIAKELNSVFHGEKSFLPEEEKFFASDIRALQKFFADNSFKKDPEKYKELAAKLERNFQLAGISPTGLFKEVIDRAKSG